MAAEAFQHGILSFLERDGVCRCSVGLINRLKGSLCVARFQPTCAYAVRIQPKRRPVRRRTTLQKKADDPSASARASSAGLTARSTATEKQSPYFPQRSGRTPPRYVFSGASSGTGSRTTENILSYQARGTRAPHPNHTIAPACAVQSPVHDPGSPQRGRYPRYCSTAPAANSRASHSYRFSQYPRRADSIT
jgi:hypothetical protein